MHKVLVKYGFGMVLVVTLLTGCTQKDGLNDKVMAQVGDKKLLVSEIDEIIPAETSFEDSIIIAEDYINKWIKRQLLVQKAEENLTVSQKDLSKEMEDYRNSLIIYRYKNEMMREKMDTSVSAEQILDYYESNKDNFKLSRNIVKAVYVKIPEEFAEPKQLKAWCKNPTDEDIIELRDYCIQYAKGYDIYTDNWVDFELVIRNIPLQVENPEQFLKQNSTIELTEDGYYYLVSIQDYKLKNELAPAEFVSENIKSLIINKRKIDFLKEVEDNIYKEGIRKNKFKINKRETNEME